MVIGVIDGATGLVLFVVQYQTELFVVGVFSNLVGIGYLLQKMGVIRFEYAA